MIISLVLLYLLNISYCEDRQMRCYHCKGGLQTQCALHLYDGRHKPCEGENVQCYEKITFYQNGALQLIERACWRPPPNVTANYCDCISTPVGEIQQCNSCNTSFCNGHFVQKDSDGRVSFTEEYKVEGPIPNDTYSVFPPLPRE